jgi:hypothetical protein
MSKSKSVVSPAQRVCGIVTYGTQDSYTEYVQYIGLGLKNFFSDFWVTMVQNRLSFPTPN